MSFVSPSVDVDYLAAGKLDPRALLGRVNDFESRAKSGQRASVERRWEVNMRWYSGEPYWRLGAKGEMEWIEPDARKTYIHVNIIFPRVQTLVGHMGYAPKFEARHAISLDAEDTERARAAADVANHGARAGGLPRAYRESQTLNHVFGHAWLKVGWDPERGPIRPTMGQVPCPTCSPGEGIPGLGAVPGPDGLGASCPTCAAEGVLAAPADLAPPRGSGFVEDVVGAAPEGDVFVDAVPPWEVYVDPEARDLFAIRELMHRRDMSRAEAFALFGADAGLSEAEMKDGGTAGVLDGFGRSTTPWAILGTRQYVSVREYYERPSQAFPRGLYAVLISEDMLRAGPLPYAHLKIPYVPVRCHVMPGELFPRSTVDNLLPAAMAMNDHLNNVHLAANQRIAMRILAVRGSGVRMSDEPGVMFYDHVRGAAAPTVMQTDNGMNNGLEMLNRLEKIADDVSFSNGVMRGEAGANVESARFAALLEERASNPVRGMIEDNAESLESAGRLILETVKLFYRDGRMIQAFGGSGRAAFREFKVSQVGSVDDVVLTATRDVGRSLASRRQEIVEAKKNGLLDDPIAMKLSEFGLDPMLQQERRVHEGAALNENHAARQGMPMAPPMQFERHDVHNETHLPLLTEFKDSLGIDHPLTQQVLQHMLAHLQVQADEQVRMQMMQAQAAAQFGMANAADPAAQPEQTQDTAAAMGQPADPVAPTTGGPPESQPLLQQVDQQFQGGM